MATGLGGNCTNLNELHWDRDRDSGYGFIYITTASTAVLVVSTTAMWGGTNKNIDLDTLLSKHQSTQTTQH